MFKWLVRHAELRRQSLDAQSAVPDGEPAQPQQAARGATPADGQQQRPPPVAVPAAGKGPRAAGESAAAEEQPPAVGGSGTGTSSAEAAAHAGSDIGAL